MSAIRADVCDNSGSDAMPAIRISWRIVVVVAVVVVNDVAQGKGSRSRPKARRCGRDRGYSMVRGGDSQWSVMDKVKTMKVDGARKQIVRPWAGMPQTVSFAVMASGARQRPLRLRCHKGFTLYIYTLGRVWWGDILQQVATSCGISNSDLFDAFGAPF
jgi:hypothetical protein